MTHFSEENKAKAIEVDRILQAYYGAPFEYFSRKEPLSQIISALLSHRTKNKVSGQAYKNLRQLYPTWEEVREGDVALIQEAISAVTYPEVKAPRIKQILTYITENSPEGFSLNFLKKMDPTAARTWLEKMPGVGIKTSAAVLNFSILRMPALVVDSHHFRVAQRLGIIPEKISLIKGTRLLEAYLPDNWDAQQHYDTHQAYMRHGQKICHWRHPNCKNCPVNHLCDYYKNYPDN